MDSQNQSTNCTSLQLPMEKLRLWVEIMILDKQEEQAAIFLQQLPLLKKLWDRGILQNALITDENEWRQLLVLVSQKNDPFQQKVNRKQTLYRFQKCLNEQYTDFYNTYGRNDLHIFDHLSVLSDQLRNLSKSSGKLFLSYLKESNSTNEQWQAFSQYNYCLNNAIDKYQWLLARGLKHMQEEMKEGGLILLKKQENIKNQKKNQRRMSTESILRRKPRKKEKLTTEENNQLFDQLLTNIEKVKDVLQRQKSRAQIKNRRN